MIREFIIDTNNTAIVVWWTVEEKKIFGNKKIFEPRLLRRRSPVAAGWRMKMMKNNPTWEFQCFQHRRYHSQTSVCTRGGGGRVCWELEMRERIKMDIECIIAAAFLLMQHFSNVSIIKYFHLTHKGRPNFKRFLQSFKSSSKAKFQKIFAIIQKQSKTRI